MINYEELKNKAVENEKEYCLIDGEVYKYDKYQTSAVIWQLMNHWERFEVMKELREIKNNDSYLPKNNKEYYDLISSKI